MKVGHRRVMNKLDAVDISTDLAILLLSLGARQISTLSSRLITITGFLAELGHVVFMFVCLFGCAFMYTDTFYRHRLRRLEDSPIARSGCASYMALLIGLFFLYSVLATVYVLFTGASMPTFTAILVAVEATLLGLFFNLDVRALSDQKARTAKGGNGRQSQLPSLAQRGNSLAGTLPYVLATTLVVFPSEYFLVRLDPGVYSPAFSVLGVLAASVAAFFLGRTIERVVSPVLIVSKSGNLGSTAATCLFAALSVVALGLLQTFVVETTVSRGDSGVTVLGAMFLFGFIPLRVLRLLGSPSVPNALIGIGSVASYALRELRVF